MGWPKGISRGKSPEQKIDLTQLRANGGQVVTMERPGTVPGSLKAFEVGKWYEYTETKLYFLPGGALATWSLLRFQVVKIAFGIAAVTFGNGKYEAIDLDVVDISDFKPAKTPNY